MSRRNDFVSLRQMLDHSVEAVELAREKTRESLDTERLLQLGLTRLVEIVGEAAGRVSGEMRTAAPEIPWSEIIGMRNRLIHGYDVVDYDILWKTIQKELPLLIEQLQAVLSRRE